MISVINWNSNKEEAPTDEYVLLYVEDDLSDYAFKYITVAWKTKDGTWIMDNEYVLGNIIAWAKFPDPKNMTIID